VLSHLIAMLGTVYASAVYRAPSDATAMVPAASMPSAHGLDDLQQALRGAQLLAAREVLDHLPYGLIAVDHTGQVLLDTVSARRILAAADVMAIQNGVVRAVAPDEDERLHAALAHVCAAPVTATTRAELVRLSGGNGNLALLLMPLRAAGDRRLAAVLIPDRHRAAAVARLLGHLFELTRSESELLRLTLTGSSVGEAAAELHLRTRTALERWRDVCWKLRAHSEADCLRLLRLALMLPVDLLANEAADEAAMP
jgi:hypothetical protein